MIRKIVVVFLCLFCGSLKGETKKQNYVTYQFTGGRFGDNLLAYLRAKWISYTYDLPLLYKPFPYSSELVLDQKELVYKISDYLSLPITPFRRHKKIEPFSKNGKIYLCYYFPECQWERENSRGPGGRDWEREVFPVNWKDPGFRQLALSLLSPKESISLTPVPKDRITIAVHVREGGSYDRGNFALVAITKFPPIDFYIQALLQTIETLPKKPIYCHVFTDAENPESIVEEIKSHIPSDAAVTFGFRQTGNTHDQNVLEDFFSLFTFDVLIRPQSNFSIVPSLLHDYAIECFPLSGVRIRDRTKIDKIHFSVNRSLVEELEKR